MSQHRDVACIPVNCVTHLANSAQSPNLWPCLLAENRRSIVEDEVRTQVQKSQIPTHIIKTVPTSVKEIVWLRVGRLVNILYVKWWLCHGVFSHFSQLQAKILWTTNSFFAFKDLRPSQEVWVIAISHFLIERRSTFVFSAQQVPPSINHTAPQKHLVS